jgi:hypothetical protein
MGVALQEIGGIDRMAAGGTQPAGFLDEGGDFPLHIVHPGPRQFRTTAGLCQGSLERCKAAGRTL